MKYRVIAVLLLIGILASVAVLCFQKQEESGPAQELKSHDFEMDGVYYSITSDKLSTVMVTYKGSQSDSYENEYSGSVIIPDVVIYENKNYLVTEIGSYAFENCAAMTSITIPKTVNTWGLGTFYGTDGLKEVHIESLSAWCNMMIPTVLDYTGSGIFNEHTCLYLNGELVTDLVIPKDVKEVCQYTFQGYRQLKSVAFHKDVSIGKSAFGYCSNLSNVKIPKNLNSVGPCAFEFTPWYENLPDGEIYFGKSFYKYKGEMPPNTTVVIKEGTETLCEGAFCSCSGLISLTLPSTLKVIQNYAIDECQNIKEVHSKGVTPPIMNRFYNDTYGAETILYVPKGSKDLYNHDSFMGINNIVEVVSW